MIVNNGCFQSSNPSWEFTQGLLSGFIDIHFETFNFKAHPMGYLGWVTLQAAALAATAAATA